MKYYMVYITASTKTEAKKVAGFLVRKKLAACVNVIPRIESVYWWKGKIERHGEAGIIAKTKCSLVDKLTAAVKSVHSYTVPCIIAIPITKGNRDYFKWIEEVV